MCKFRLLEKDEIECRVQSVMKDNSGAILLLYKTARTDYNLLDETYGELNWKCSYEEIKGNLYCTISVYNKDINEWVSKSNCGVESNTEAEKGEASDSLKRAGFAWGIGRELYTAPFTYIKLTDADFKNSKLATKFNVSEIEYTDRKITKLIIVDDKGNTRFTFGVKEPKTSQNKDFKENNDKTIKEMPKTQKNGKKIDVEVVSVNKEEERTQIERLEALKDLIFNKCEYLGKDSQAMVVYYNTKYKVKTFDDLTEYQLSEINAQLDKAIQKGQGVEGGNH